MLRYKTLPREISSKTTGPQGTKGMKPQKNALEQQLNTLYKGHCCRDSVGGCVMSQHDVLMLSTVANMLRLYADMLNVIAGIEEASGRKADELLKELLSPQSLAKLSQKLPSDVFGEFMSALLRLATALASVQNPLALPSNEKRRLAFELSEIAKSIENVVERLKAMKQ
jgi:hypothetical protein